MLTSLRLVWVVFLVSSTRFCCYAVNFISFENIKENAEVADKLSEDNLGKLGNEKRFGARFGAYPVKRNPEVTEKLMQQVASESWVEVEQEDEKNKIHKVPDQTSHMNYQRMHYRGKRNPEAELKGFQARVLEKILKKLVDEYGLPVDKARKQLNVHHNNVVKRTVCTKKRSAMICDPYSFFRSFTGHCNNLNSPHLGAVNTPFNRLITADYADGIAKPRESKGTKPLPNARLFSRNVFTDKDRFSNNFTHLLMTWGQYIDHDIALGQQPQNLSCPSGNTPCSHSGECFGIRVPTSDPDFHGTKCMRMKRDVPARAPDPRCIFNKREQVNTLTSFIDASQVYGTNLETVNDLRDFSPDKKGQLKISSLGSLDRQPLLPKAPKEDFCRTSDRKKKPCFRAGDGRVNENPALAAIHTLFMREHNRIAKTLANYNKLWSSDRVFQETRKIIGALLQHITYNEFLPLVLNHETRKVSGLILEQTGYFDGYDDEIDPSIINSFAGAAFRFGHTLVRGDFSHIVNSTRKSSVLTKDVFEDPKLLYDTSNGGVDAILRGLVTDKAEQFDRHFASALTKHLIIAPNIIIDLPAINIQRGREHGLPGYNQFREICHLENASSFDDLRREISLYNRNLLKKYYGHVDDIDLFVGGVLETPLPGAAVGPTFSCLIAKQFCDLRYGDRFWYERGDPVTRFTDSQLKELRKVSLARVICNNSDDIHRIQRRVMEPAGSLNPLVDCNNLPEMSLNAWKKSHY